MKMATIFTRPIAALMAAELLASTACGNLAVPPPFEQAGAWPVEKGDHVIVLLKTGEKIEGKVEAIDEAGFLIGERRVRRDEIDKMWMKRGNTVAGVGESALVVGVVLTLAVVAFLAVLDHALGDNHSWD